MASWCWSRSSSEAVVLDGVPLPRTHPSHVVLHQRRSAVRTASRRTLWGTVRRQKATTPRWKRACERTNQSPNSSSGGARVAATTRLHAVALKVDGDLDVEVARVLRVGRALDPPLDLLARADGERLLEVEDGLLPVRVFGERRRRERERLVELPRRRTSRRAHIPRASPTPRAQTPTHVIVYTRRAVRREPVALARAARRGGGRDAAARRASAVIWLETRESVRARESERERESEAKESERGSERASARAPA